MDPLCIFGTCIELSMDLGTILASAVGAIATILQHKHHKENYAQRERQMRQMQASSGEGPPARSDQVRLPARS